MGTGWRLVIGDIITQFLIEATTLSAIGGVIGVAVGLAIAALVRNVSPLGAALRVGCRFDSDWLTPRRLRNQS